jgi:hypothetical protein
MNERIKELAEQAGFHIAKAFNGIGWLWCSDEYPIDEELERFAELVRQDEAKACAEHYLSIMRDAVEQAVLREREACAQVCDDWLVGRDDICEVAKAIRARGRE